MEGLFSLGNNDFQSFGPKLLRKLYFDKESTNVTLISSEFKILHAHKSVLNVASNLFKDFFSVIKLDKPVFFFKDLPIVQLERILKFLYLGQCQVPQDKVDEFIAAGQELKLYSLSEIDQRDNNDGKEHFARKNYSRQQQTKHGYETLWNCV